MYVGMVRYVVETREWRDYAVYWIKLADGQALPSGKSISLFKESLNIHFTVIFTKDIEHHCTEENCKHICNSFIEYHLDNWQTE